MVNRSSIPGLILNTPIAISRANTVTGTNPDMKKRIISIHGYISPSEGNPRPMQWWVGGSNDNSSWAELYNLLSNSAAPQSGIEINIEGYKYIKIGSGNSYYNYERVAYFDTIELV